MASSLRWALLLQLLSSVTPLTTTTQEARRRTFHYFAYGSNMALTTMTALRDLDPLACTPAVLPGHRLLFDVPGLPWVEPSWASVEPTTTEEEEEEVVHGVLYTLTEEDFVSVCRTEGVPLSYRLHRCAPVPYRGDGAAAGRAALARPDRPRVRAFTLRSPGTDVARKTHRAPSRAYRNVLVRGAKEFALDADYVQRLENIIPGKTLFGDGFAERMLTAAEQRKSRRK